ncbi:hypothetical protein [Aestuariimicrobium ganziense]|uniref:hypothetical protein n=1 Tax=Aestuariimicrobium ganziense TaxID=2773677 RepID=UPI0019418CDB|nr:hypothetical protein [Aestuariimicrobium ganziense]
MGTGVIFGVVAVGFLAYLVPWFITRRGQEPDDAAEERFASSMTLIRNATNAFSDSADPLLEVSTPMTRRAGLAEVAATHRRAAVRRRRALLTLVLLTGATAVAAALVSRLPWWSVAVPGGLLVAFLLVARFSVVTLNRQLDERAAEVNSGWEEDTISFAVPADLRAEGDSDEFSIELSGPIQTGSLWEPIPVTAPTYISKPLAPRTVRTIDLSSPVAALKPAPVVAEAPEASSAQSADEVETPRAVNE